MQTNRPDASTFTIPQIAELGDAGSCMACFSEIQAMRNGILLNLDVTTRKVGSLLIFAGCCAALSQKKPSKNVVAMLDDWVLVYERTAREASKQQGENAGSKIWIQSTSVPIDRKRAVGELMLIQFPRSCFKGLESHIEAICKGEADFVASPLLASYLESLWNYLPQLRENEAQVVEEITSQLVRSCVARTIKMRGGAARPASMNRLEAASSISAIVFLLRDLLLRTYKIGWVFRAGSFIRSSNHMAECLTTYRASDCGNVTTRFPTRLKLDRLRVLRSSMG